MILVTGATGFAGSHLLDRLPAGSEVTAWSSRDVDLRDRRATAAGIRAVQPATIFHLAGAPHVGTSFSNPAEPLGINAVATHYLLSAVAEHAPKARVVVVTSAMIYAPSGAPHTESSATIPSSPYALSKLAQDRLATLAAESGLDVVTARPFNHTGARQAPSFSVPGFAEQIARIESGASEPTIRVGNLDAERDITDVRDVVDGYALLARAGERGAAYNVCRGTAFRIGDLLEMMLSMARVRVTVEVDKERLRPVELPRLVGDNSRLRELGWEPRIPVDEMLAGVLAYWRSRVAG